MKNKVQVYLGTWLKNLKDLHSTEYKAGYTLNENTFFQKLVPEEVLKKGMRIKPVDYFRGLVFIDYFVNVIQGGDYRICDNLINISKALREQEREDRIRIGPASFLTLETVVLETGLCAKEVPENFYAQNFNNIKQRYQNRYEKIDFKSPSLRKCCLYYLSMGQMVYDLVKEKKSLLGGIASRSQLGALVFADSILGTLDNLGYKAQINKSLDKKEFLKASLTALACISKETTEQRIKKAIWKGLKQNGR